MFSDGEADDVKMGESLVETDAALNDIDGHMLDRCLSMWWLICNLMLLWISHYSAPAIKHPVKQMALQP